MQRVLPPPPQERACFAKLKKVKFLLTFCPQACLKKQAVLL